MGKSNQSTDRKISRYETLFHIETMRIKSRTTEFDNVIDRLNCVFDKQKCYFLISQNAIHKSQQKYNLINQKQR